MVETMKTVANSQIVAQIANAVGVGRIVAGANGTPNTFAARAFADTGTFAPFIVTLPFDSTGLVTQAPEPSQRAAPQPSAPPATTAEIERAQQVRGFIDRFMRTLSN